MKSRKKIVQPAFHGGWFLAPTTKQRLDYARYLHVWGKDKVHVPRVLKEKFESIHVCWILPLTISIITLMMYYLQGQVRDQPQDVVWFHEPGGNLHDPFHPFFIHQALQEQSWMKYLVFGSDSNHCSSLPDMPEHPDLLREWFEVHGQFFHLFSNYVLLTGYS